jgi:hypothetical protein
MQTFSANGIAERLRNIPPDRMVKGKPQWKISTASRAVEAHLHGYDSGGRGGGGRSGGVDAALQALYDQHERREAAMRALPTLDERREAARAMIPPLIEMDKASRQTGLANGQDRDLVHLRCDAMLHLHARGIEMATEWTHDEVWMMVIEADSDGDE